MDGVAGADAEDHPLAGEVTSIGVVAPLAAAPAVWNASASRSRRGSVESSGSSGWRQ
jgi:hypothetical protein